MWAKVGAGSLAGAAALLAYGVRGRSSSLLAPSVYRGSRARQSIALTFDDGPTPSTLRLLKVLTEYRTPATFFQCGVHVRRRGEIARAVADAGHEIGNHTDTHQMLSLRSHEFILDELTRAQDAIKQATGENAKLFRAPYGVRWFGLRAAQRKLGLMGVMWTSIGLDWKLDARAVAARLLRAAGNGAILCLHDGRGLDPDPAIDNTIEAVKQIVPALLEAGFSFETVSQLLCPTK